MIWRIVLIMMGSPPQVRGKRPGKVFQQSDAGITPAGAGKTEQVHIPRALVWDHPRRCGENIYFYLLALGQPGSPPQVRGKQDGTGIFILRGRITPAGAGKTYIPYRFLCWEKDHPRRCGEN